MSSILFRSKFLQASSFALILIAVLFFNINCNNNPQNKSVEQLKEYASLSDTVEYVGMQTCAQCHQAIYKTFIETGMGKSFEAASRKKSSASFSHSIVYDTFSDFNYQAHWVNDSIVFTEYRLKASDTIYSRSETVNYIIGSGQHTNSHMINRNGYVYQAPMTYYTQKQQWDLPPGFEGGYNSRFNRAIGLECMSCHNSYPKFEIGRAHV